MKEILLTQGKVTIVDDEDYERLNQVKWHAHTNGSIFYAVRTCRGNKNRKGVKMHREILNAPPGMHCDHINSDGLDNRKENLRLCTQQQNMCNKRNAYRNNKSGIKGVSWNKKQKKFVAQIQLGGKKIHLGSYNVLGDADSAYRIAEEKYFGDFARNHSMNNERLPVIIKI